MDGNNETIGTEGFHPGMEKMLCVTSCKSRRTSNGVNMLRIK